MPNPDPHKPNGLDGSEEGFPHEDRVIARMLNAAGRRIGEKLREQSQRDGIPLVVEIDGETCFKFPDGRVLRHDEVPYPRPWAVNSSPRM